MAKASWKWINGKWFNAITGEPMPAGEQKARADQFAADLKSGKVRPRISGTDSQLFSGKMTLAEQFKNDPLALDHLVSKCRAAGFTPNPTDQYLPEIATEVCDPRAVISMAGGKQQIVKELTRQGRNCDGQVRVRAYRPEPPKVIPLGENLIREEISNRIAKDPGLKHKDRRELREQVIAEHARKTPPSFRKPRAAS